jgi:macrolide transport system ATP-binding/permease protein
MENLVNDLWYGVRSLLKRPSFTVVAVLTLALGIGINTTVFSLANSVFLRQLPVASPHNLVWLFSGNDNPSSYLEYLEYRNQTDLFDGVLASEWIALNLGSEGHALRVEGAVVSANYFDVLGVTPKLGRTFSSEEDKTQSPVALISESLWQRQFGADQNVVGKSLVLNGHPFTVIGVAPREFVGTEEAFPREIWIPLQMKGVLRPGPHAPNNDPLNDRTSRSFDVMARLKAGVSFNQAQTAMNVVASRLAQNYPETNANFRIALYAAGNGRPIFRNLLKPVTQILLSIVGLVLLIACANVGNLLLSRAVGRRKELAIRLTLGATRMRLIRQLLMESLLLSCAGGMVGLILNFWLINSLAELKPPVPLALNIEFHTDWRVLIFTLLISVLAGIVFGLVPAIQSSKQNLVPALKDQAGQLGDHRSFFRLRNALVIGQVSLSIVVLIGAGLFLRSLNHARAIDPGFDADRVLTLSFHTNAQGYDERKAQQFYQQLTERIQTLPGVDNVSIAQSAPLSFFYAPAFGAPMFVEGHEPPQGTNPLIVGMNTVGPNFFNTINVPLLLGRDFNNQDQEETPRVAIVNETLVHSLFPDGNALGQRLRVLGRRPASYEIVGIVKDSKYRSLGEDPTPYIFVPYSQSPQASMSVHVHTNGNPKQLIAAIRREVQTLDPNLPAFNVTTLADNIEISLFPARLGALLLGVFGALALLIASIGIYGVMSFGVSERTREMGIRMALGAQRGDVLRMVIWQGMKVAAIGVAIGSGLAFVSTRVVSSYLYDVSTTDPATFTGITIILIGVALLACYLPARRATGVDPLVALRYE